MTDSFIDRSSFWALAGVGLGFLLGEGSRWIRHRLRAHSLKRMVRHELTSIRAQIPQKQDILQQMRAALRRGNILSGVSVRAVTTGYTTHGPELYPHLSVVERNCLHVIYERLAVADRLMDAFDSDFVRAKAAGVVNDPFDAYSHRLQELHQSYDVVRSLIDDYLKGGPPDVFAVAG